jgi:hypothetical protein
MTPGNVCPAPPTRVYTIDEVQRGVVKEEGPIGHEPMVSPNGAAWTLRGGNGVMIFAYPADPGWCEGALVRVCRRCGSLYVEGSQ